MTPRIDITGKKFHKLTVVRWSGTTNGYGISMWDCICECGKSHRARSTELRSGRLKSCGCQKIESATKHGLFLGGHGLKDKFLKPELRKVYRAWRSIKTRCFDENSKPYKDYGARGISMCDEWRNDFPRFLMDVGFAPTPKHSIGRIDNDGHYTKDNCRWETSLEQQGNRRATRWIEMGDEKICMAEAARRIGITPVALAHRIKNGYPATAIFGPKKQGGRSRRLCPT